MRIRTCGIYAIRGEEKSYVGSSVDVHQRWTNHRILLRNGNHPNIHLQRAWNKYGEEAFEFVVLEECSADQLIEREQHYIDTTQRLYNCCLVADSWLGRTHSSESKAKMRAAKLGRTHTPEAIEKMRGNKNRAGTITSPEGCANISASKMGNTYRKGKKASPETRAKMLGNKNSAGRVVSTETREKISAAVRAHWENKRRTDSSNGGTDG